ncbi:MAG TPA: cytochrome c oxidase assembly protein [bacterium]|nr:cytochrome c oxidase assembly protein [bacterium]
MVLAHLSAHPPALEPGFWELLRQGWFREPWAVAGILATALIYFGLRRGTWDRHSLHFSLGCGVLFLALASPIAAIAEDYLFSVHMLQHLLLEVVAVPLLLIGIPKSGARRLLRYPWLRKVAGILGDPIVAWTIGVGMMWIWHWPALFNWTLESRAAHAFEHFCFIAAATVFWNAVLDPIESFRLKPFAAVAYLFSACAAHTLLAVLITFAPPGLYPKYSQLGDPLGLGAMLRQRWGLDPATDQQLGGAFLWMMGCFIFILFILAVLARYYRQPERDLPLEGSRP